MKAITCLLLYLAFGAVVAAQNWPSFRGPNASGVADGQNPPTSWDVTKSVNVKWNTAIPGLGHSSPIVWADRVFVTTAISKNPKSQFRPRLDESFESDKDVSEHAWRVYCLDKNTGKILWERTAHTGVPKTKRHPTSSHASPTPVTDGRHVVAFFGSEGLYAYNFEGKLLWKQDLGVLSAGWSFNPDVEWGVGSSPIIYDNLVIVQCDIQKDSFLAAYDLRDGRPVWRTPRAELPSWSTPTIHQGKIQVELITNGKHIRGYHPLTGKELWSLSSKAEFAVSTPFVAQDLIFINDSWMSQPLYAIRVGASGDISLKDGALSNESVAWSIRRGGQWYLTTPIVYGDLLYTCSNNGILACYRAKTGDRLYHQRIGGKGGSYTASGVAADGKLYFTSQDGDIYVVKAGPKYELLSANSMGEVCMATPALADGMIFVRTQNHVYAIGEPRAARRQ